MKKFSGRAIFALLAAAAMLALLPAGADAGVINVGNGATGSDPLGTGTPSDPQRIGFGTDVSIEVQGSGAITTHVLMVVLIPNNTTDKFGTTNPLGTITVWNQTFPGMSTGTGTSAFTGTGFGLGGGSLTYMMNGFWGDFTAQPGSPKLADALDSNLSSSLNGPNFVAFDKSLGVPALSNVMQYGVYTFDISTGPVGPHKGEVGLVDIQIPGGLPQGSIVIALDDNLDSTVWTNAGGVTGGAGGGGGNSDAPEPSTLFVLGAGLVGLAVIRRYRRIV